MSLHQMFLSVYTLKTVISLGIVLTLLIGITLLYILVYAFIISSVTAQILPDFRNGFIATFMTTSVLMILSSLAGIYGLIRKKNKFVILYSVTMLIYFVVFIVLIAYLIKLPAQLENQCNSKDVSSNSIREAVEYANETLCKTCTCYFYNMGDYTKPQQDQLKKMGFINYTNDSLDNGLPVNAQNCDQWSNETYAATNTIIFLQTVFNCSGWCSVPQQYNLYYLFTNVNHGRPKQTCIQSLLAFFNKFGVIMKISCIVVSSILFFILLNILCLCFHPDRGQQYDALRFFKTTLMVELNQEEGSTSGSGGDSGRGSLGRALDSSKDVKIDINTST